MAQPGFWDDPQAAQKVVTEASRIREQVRDWEALGRRADDVAVLLDLALEEHDAESAREAARDLVALEQAVDRMELATLLSGPYDGQDAILSIHPGAGGTESQDWAQMLLRMYTRWAEEGGYQAELLDLLPGDEAGLKSATLSIRGKNAYGYLKAEKGVHRLVRISPFDASGRRHTSFASVDVLPDVQEANEVEVRPEELKIDTYRASGAGGQYVNKTESAIRITHLPTGLVVTCQTERSQHSNREAAMKILKARLLALKLEEQRQKLDELRGQQGEIAWGNQIRSYVFAPYTMVKDHRTGAETGNVQAVMDGDLDLFIQAYLRSRGRA
ncbi:peptide chain release factor 2 [Limnochorda pilosa]|uniref:Peptide chain release factor 2 n=2 Tax=Limnochorda pilosa TaxID=1555112 RepID=A0A0K2SPM6_LIMPI|nr:peptide chain release factor 2 [Limnochorda pilosa]